MPPVKVMQDGSILIIDDDLDFSCLLQVALQEAGVEWPVAVINDSQAAVAYLQDLPETGGVCFPSLILLDLRMPGLSGLEVLRWIRSELRLQNVPVVVFTGMEGGPELSQAVELGAASLRIKPFSYRELVHEARHLRSTFLEPRELGQAA